MSRRLATRTRRPDTPSIRLAGRFHDVPGRRIAILTLIAAVVVGGLVALALTSDGTPVEDGSPGAGFAANTTATSTSRVPIEETPEYIASNEPCPPDLPELTAVPVANFGIELQPFLTLPDPTVLTFVDETSGFLADRTGRVYSFDPAGLSSQPVIDLSDNTGASDDQGLLGLTVDPAGNWLYLHHTVAEGDSVVRAYPLEGSSVNADGGVEIIVVDQPSRQHNGGDLAFGPDGYLYVSFGDGGGLGDPRHHGQDLGTVLGAILRLDVDPTTEPRYRPAPGNPYIGMEGRSELIWAHGVRNPFRLSFDRVQGDLWVADVGQQCIEEINHLTTRDGGTNLGWNAYEGSRRFVGDQLPDHRPPDFEYRHGVGLCAIVGGYVYRGAAFPELLGRYVFTDLCNGRIYAVIPGGTPEVIELPLSVARPVAFGEDPAGELYVVSNEEGIVYRLGSTRS